MLLVNYIKCSDFVLLIWLEFSLINIYVANFENFVGNRLGNLEIFQGDFKFPSSFLYNFPNFLLTFLNFLFSCYWWIIFVTNDNTQNRKS